MCHKHRLPALWWAKIHNGRDVVLWLPHLLGEITLGKHLWCCVLPRPPWTPAASALASHRLHKLHDSKAILEFNVKTRSSELPKRLIGTTICSESETSPDTASPKADVCPSQFDGQDTPRVATEWDKTSPTSARSPVTLAKQTSAFRGRWRREWKSNERWSTLTAYKLTCLYFPEPHGGCITLFPSLSCSRSLNQQTQLSGPTDLSQVILPSLDQSSLLLSFPWLYRVKFSFTRSKASSCQTESFEIHLSN